MADLSKHLIRTLALTATLSTVLCSTSSGLSPTSSGLSPTSSGLCPTSSGRAGGDSAPESRALRLTAVPPEYRRAVMAQDWDGAVRAVEERLRQEPDQEDFWLYLRALAQGYDGERGRAIDVLIDLEQRFPDSVWIHKARFQRADFLRELRHFEEAEAIYEEELARLRSPERQRELAGIYIDFADELSTPPEVAQPDAGTLDYARAYVLYQKVLELDAPRELREQALYRSALCRQELQQWDVAIAEYQKYLAAFDPSEENSPASRDGAGRWIFDARYRLGRSQLAAGRGVFARRSFEDLAAAVADARAGRGGWGEFWRSLEDAQRGDVQHIDGDARFAVAETYPRASQQETPLAIAALRRFLEAHPDHSRASEAAFQIAEHYREIGRQEDALEAYEAFLNSPLPTAAGDEVREVDARLRMSSLFLKGRVLMDQARYEQAIATWSEYTARHATGSEWAQAQQGIVYAEYSIGAKLRAEGDHAAARTAWTAFLEAHPLDNRATQIQFDLGELYVEEAKTLEDKGEDEEREAELAGGVQTLLRSALVQWRKVATKYSGSNHASQALYRRGVILESELKELDQAIEAYRECNFGPYAHEAQARLVQMTNPALSALTERSFRSDEAARVAVSVRNIEKLEVQVYQLDLEAYFRKHLTHEDVEDLDLDLITADEKFEVEVADYAAYQPIEWDLELPVEGPGVWAVALTADDLRATTLVIRSDIDVIVKSSRREVFVFAEDMRNGRPAADVEVLVGIPADPASGRPTPIIKELKTEADGVARLVFEELESTESLRVFAMREKSCASNWLKLEGLQLSSGLSPRGVVYTDRTAYRPGQDVSWRAILRDVENGSYSFEAGQGYRIEIEDSEGRVFLQRELELSAFGTLSDELALDELAPIGNYTIRCQAPGGPVFSGSFLVEEYRLQKVELELDPEREVYYRGETVEVAVRAAYYYGEPVSDSPLRYNLPDGRVGEARTDAEGRARFSFNTRDFPSEGSLSFGATLTEEQVSASGRIYLAVRGYNLTLSTPRSVYLAGDSFGISVEARSPAGEGVARELELSILRREHDARGQQTEVLIEEFALETDEQGKASHSVNLEKGGRYTLRAEGTDRFGNPVSAQRRVFVSGEEDTQRLRLIAERQSLKVGESVVLDLVNRTEKGLALITFEGETILDYRLVELERGPNRVEIEVDHEHFPNFAVSAAMMIGDEFYSAQTDFSVERQLKVSIETEQETYAPGEQVPVRLTVTDQLGRPVAAELSLAVVDVALLEIYPDHLPALSTIFQAGAQRQAALRTETSCTFSYSGATRTIAEAVLAEEVRAQAAETWDRRRQEVVGALRQLEDSESRLGFASQDKIYSGPGDTPAEMPVLADSIIVTGGAGGSFGGRYGGKSASPSSREAAGARSLPVETAFWTPAVVTDAEGRASVSFEMPQRSTRWRLTCRGVAKESIFGDQTSEIVSRAEFFVELKTPARLIEGDEPRFLARIHNLTGRTGSAELRLRLSDGTGRDAVYPARVELGSEAVVEYLFPASDALQPTSALGVELTASAELSGTSFAHDVRESVRVSPWGVAASDAGSGVLRDEASLSLELPGEGGFEDCRLELFVGRGVDHMLISEALGRVGPFPRFGRHPIVTHADSASDLIGVCAVIEHSGPAGAGQNPEQRALRERAASLVARLVAAQREDGGWSWTAKAGASDGPTSANAVLALARARKLGIGVPAVTRERGVTFLKKAFRDASQQANELKAMLIYALAAQGQIDFGAANRLHRQRNSLSPAGLAYTALALVEMGRAPMAADLARLLEEKSKLDRGADRPSASWRVAGNIAWNRSQLEMTALALQALEAALPASARIEPGIEYLVTQRPWFPYRARGRAIAAIARYRGEIKPARERVEIAVRVEGQAARTLLLPESRPGASLELDLGSLADGKLRVDLALRGRGEPDFSAVLHGFSSKVKERSRNGLSVKHHRYFADRPLHRGQEVHPGFSVLRNYRERWDNMVSELPVGKLTRAQVVFRRDYQRNAAREEDEFLMLEIPLPAGTQVLPGSVRGNFQQHVVRDGRLIVWVGPHRGESQVNYTLIGALPGTFRVLPVVLSSAYQPQNLALSKPGSFSVLPRGAVSGDEYRPTPDELYKLGGLLYSEGDYERARPMLLGLYDEYERDLRPDSLREAASMLFFMGIEASDSGAIVRFFEVLKEKNPELTIPFEKVLAVGEAYRELGEFERALLIFRATVEETFGKDLKVAGTLEEQNEFAATVDTLERLWREYPDLPAVVETYLALSDKLLTKAPVAHLDESLRRAGRDRAALNLEGILLLSRFLALYPKDPLAPEAGLNLVSAYLNLEDYETSARLAGELAEQVTDPKFIDAFQYTRAVAEWYLEHQETALGLLSAIAEAEYTDEGGNPEPSENRDLALYILGQIHHAQRNPEKASEYYEMVADQFADAKEALETFYEKSISMEEVTTARPGENTALELTYRNVRQAELLVYAVDLMTLYLREKNLSNVTQVNLAGIAPAIRRTIELGDGTDLRPQSRSVDLALEQPGAYLVICRGDELHTSGLMLVSDLELEVKEDSTSGRLRVQALNQEDGRYLRGVDVRVIGSSNSEFVSGHTDPRGLFVADSVRGTSTVIARLDDSHYAFYRGARALGELEEELEADRFRQSDGDFGQVDQQGYFKNVFGLNNDNQVQRQQRLQSEIQRARKGVQVKQVK